MRAEEGLVRAAFAIFVSAQLIASPSAFEPTKMGGFWRTWPKLRLANTSIAATADEKILRFKILNKKGIRILYKRLNNFTHRVKLANPDVMISSNFLFLVVLQSSFYQRDKYLNS